MLSILLIFVFVTTQGTSQSSLPSTCNGLRDGNPACGPKMVIPGEKMMVAESNNHEKRNGLDLEGVNLPPQARHGAAYTSDNFYHPWSVKKTWQTYGPSQSPLRSNKYGQFSGVIILLPSNVSFKKLYHNYKNGNAKRRPPGSQKKPKKSQPQSTSWHRPDDSLEGMKLKSSHKRKRPGYRPPGYRPPRPPRPPIPDYDYSEGMKLKAKHQKKRRPGGHKPPKPPGSSKSTTTKKTKSPNSDSNENNRPKLDVHLEMEYSKDNEGGEEESSNVKLKGKGGRHPGVNVRPFPFPSHIYETDNEGGEEESSNVKLKEKGGRHPGVNVRPFPFPSHIYETDS